MSLTVDFLEKAQAGFSTVCYRDSDVAVALVPRGAAAMSAAGAAAVVEAQQPIVGTTTVSCQITRLLLVEQHVRQPLSTQVTVAGAQTVSQAGAQRTGSQQTVS